ncbi:MAG: DUF4954 family protein [Sphaerochaetaceae bacterium]|nr:DUF4954 family protein [Sphaerochaetaceae bacterium]
MVTHSKDEISRPFIDSEYLGPGEDEYRFRFVQNPRSYRDLEDLEISALIRQGNYSDDWSLVKVSEEFDPALIKDTLFFGLVRLGQLSKGFLSYHDYVVPEGIAGCTIISSDVGDHCSLINCHYISHYIIQDSCILANIDELQATSHSKFGNGVVKEGEDPSVKVTIAVQNENEGRRISAFESMTIADAYLWASNPIDETLMQRLEELTRKVCPPQRGYYGIVGTESVIKSCRIIKDVNVGPSCYIKGANKLKNLTINSSALQGTQIGEGVEMVNGIIGFGCHVFYGVMAVRFCIGDNCSLKYGARLLNSVLGDNSTISCCEVLNNLIFPFHEQHHNNSFLIASLVKGQSNMAAAATIGSNHNSRGADGELVAGRGFWPGLSTNLKHPSCFASFTLIAKGSYPSELNIELPFSLLSENAALGRREIMPAYWWMHNLYAMERNSFKFKTRDKRKAPRQVIETGYLAPDTVFELRKGCFLLSLWSAKATIRATARQDLQAFVDNAAELRGVDACEYLEVSKPFSLCAWDKTPGSTIDLLTRLAAFGSRMMLNEPHWLDNVNVLAEQAENGLETMLIKHPREGYISYKEMLCYYSIREIAQWCISQKIGFKTFLKDAQGQIQSLESHRTGLFYSCQAVPVIDWKNMGGQLVPSALVNDLIARIKSRSLDSWDDVHQFYDELQRQYPFCKAVDALLALGSLYHTLNIDEPMLKSAKARAIAIRLKVQDGIRDSRTKDYTNFYRTITYTSKAEMDKVVGDVVDNPFVASSARETESFIQTVNYLEYDKN